MSKEVSKDKKDLGMKMEKMIVKVVIVLGIIMLAKNIVGINRGGYIDGVEKVVWGNVDDLDIRYGVVVGSESTKQGNKVHIEILGSERVIEKINSGYIMERGNKVTIGTINNKSYVLGVEK